MSVAFVLGGANTLQDDLAAARELVTPDTIIACNDAGVDYEGELPHFCTLHTEKLINWMKIRESKGLPPPHNYWTSNTKFLPSGFNFRRVKSWDGSSGLLCISVAIELGFTHIILCGVPLEKKAAHYHDSNDWRDAPKYRAAWVKYLPHMKHSVRSMSGWTQKLLGAPSVEWLYGSSTSDETVV